MITTIIPTYKRAKSLQKAIESTLNQTFPFFEVWIYDNSSNDETEEVVLNLMKKDSRINYYKHPSNIGAVANFNFGLKRIHTPFFSFLSDDDVLFPNFYETAIKGFEKYPKAGFIAGSVLVKNEKGKVVHVATESWKDQEYYDPPEGLWEMIPKHLDWMGILFKKEVRDKIGEIDCQVKAIDVDFLYRASSHFSFVVLKKPCGIFNLHPNSYSYHSPLKVIWPSWLKITRNLKKELEPSIWPQIDLAMNNSLRQKTLSAFVHNIKMGKFRAARKAAVLIRYYFKYPSLSKFMIFITQCMQWVPASRILLFAALKIKNLGNKKKKQLEKKYRSQ